MQSAKLYLDQECRIDEGVRVDAPLSNFEAGEAVL